MFVVGLTGGIGSGKTAATDEFARLGITVVDADQVARDVVKPGTEALAAIIARHGPALLSAEHALNRPALRQIVFNDPAERLWLEQLLHPLIAREILQQLAASTSLYTILASPLLFESGQVQMTQRALVIDCPEELQIQRASSRDNSSPEQIRNIMAAQLPRQQRQQQADDLINNDADLPALHTQVQQFHTLYLKMAEAR